MAKASMIQRELKREKMVAKFAKKRATYKKDSINFNLTPEQRAIAMAKLHALPINSSKVRLRSRCKITGRPNAVYSKFGLCRNKLREHVMQGDLPGVKKSSW